MNGRRVVITGIGMLTPLGKNAEESWAGICAGKSGIRKITNFDASIFTARISGTVQNFDPLEYMPQKEVRKTDMFLQYGVAAAKQAIVDSGIDLEKIDKTRAGVAIGSGIGGIPMIERSHLQYIEHGVRRISPFFIPAVIINMVSGYVAIEHGLKGPNIAIVTACTTGTHNIGDAARMIAYGDADIMIAGGTEMATSAMGIGGFCAMRALSTRNDEPEKASRPWDKDRDGFVLGDGAGIVFLEEYEHAVRRGAKIYAEVSGYGMSCDAHHMTAPDRDGPKSAMMNSVRDAHLNLEQVDYINAHGTSTPLGDHNEAMSIKEAFGDHAKKLAVSSTKSMTGHLLGAAGAVEAIFCALAIRDQIAPPTINLDNPDEDCDLDFVPHIARKMKIDVALSNSFGFGGTNGSLVLTKV